MSNSTLSVHEDYEKQDDMEKNPPDLVEDVEGLETIQRTPTTPPAQITELDKGLIAWESQKDSENPLSVPLEPRSRSKRLTVLTDTGLRRRGE